MSKYKEFTREDYENEIRISALNYSEYEIKQRMKFYDEQQEWNKSHPSILPNDMKQVSFTGYSDESIDDNIEMHCDCGSKFVISGGYLTICPGCGRMYRVINYIAQYEAKS